MKILLKLFILLSIVLVARVAQAETIDKYIVPYSKLLSKYVVSGEKNNIKTVLVDYNLWGKDPLYSQVLQDLELVNPEKLLNNNKKAFWINAYNILTIDLIVKSNEKETIKNLGSLFKNAWKSHSWKIDKKAYTLDEIENKILRPMGDPRIHMAINCASLSCPNLLAEPYISDKLDSQLNKQARSFINNPTKGVQLINSKLKISKIFSWFADDFGNNNGVIEFIKNNSNIKLPNTIKINKYFDYNWKLNSKN